jgi:hypothetical protein
MSRSWAAFRSYRISGMGMFGEAAIRSTRYFLTSKARSPQEAWPLAMTELSRSRQSQTKSCPRNAYLGLCEAGVIRGISTGEYDAPSDNKNGRYALKAYQVLQSKPSLAADKKALWIKATMPENIRHNEQMDVVVSLWKQGLLR